MKDDGKDKKTGQELINITGGTQTVLQRVLKIFSVICKVMSFAVVLLFCFLGMLLFEGIRWALDTWSNLSMEEIVYHLQSPLEGTNQDLIYDFMNAALSPAILVLVTTLIILLIFRKKKHTQQLVMKIMIALSLCVGFSSVYFGWKTLKVGDYLAGQSEESTFIQDNYVPPDSVEITFPEQKRNLIYIFLESMESTYSSKKNGGAYEDNYIPELTRLAKENTHFSNTDLLGGAVPTKGATWTIGGMFAQTSGLPLLIPIGDNSMDTQDTFLPDVTALGDILKNQGYQQMLMVGSDATFGGRKNYFTHHGNFGIYDVFTARESGDIPEDYTAWWGFEDEKLFSFAQQKILELSLTGQPFNFTMLTADTHFEDGYPCRLCDDKFEDNQYANVIACSSRQVYAFVQWIQQQEFYANTTIVISGDHLTMDSDFCEDIDSEYERTVYNVIINPAITTERTKNRIFTTLDMFPTTLAAMGVDIEGNKLGLGTNLFSDKDTLAEEYGRIKINNEFGKNSSFFSDMTKNMLSIEGNVLELNHELQLLKNNIPDGFGEKTP
ncbi:MAG: LTA synthase family protein [Hespellia sp.]|nr:LTA synthase family protein [Hespellia sp.]